MIQAALVVGCGEFVEPNISPLKYAARDAERFARCLTDLCGLEADNIALLADARVERERPSVANITRTISIIEQRCNTQQVSRIILYLSGHGIISSNDNNLYFLCRETYDGDIEKTAISVDSMITRIRNAKPLEAIVILDTCRTGSIKNKGIDDSRPFLEPNRLSGPGMVVVYSCQLGQRSYESDALTAGLFTESLLRGLGEPGECTGVRDLKNYLDKELPALSRAESKPVQIPYFVLENSALNDLVIVAPDVYARRRQTLILKSEVYDQDDLPSLRLTERPELCGIDFGTTKSLVTAYDSTRGVVYIPCIGNVALLRSSLFVHPDYRYRVGQSAFEHYRTRRSGYIQDMKRRIGQSQTYRVDEVSLDASSCIAMILSSIRRTLSLVAGSDVNQAVISFPVNFTWGQHLELVHAFTTAGFEIIRAVSEAAAAAVALEATEHTQGTVFILDMGGGTFDACLASLGDGVIEIIDVYGDRELGGRDFDEALRSLVNMKIDSLNSTAQGRYWIPQSSAYDEQIEKIKFQINTTESGSYELTGVPTITGNELELSVPINLREFKQISRDICFRVRSRLTSALSKFQDARPGESINLIMLAGQASKLRFVREEISRVFPGVPVFDSLQENAVATGLAYQCGILEAKRKDMLLLDIFPWQLGILAKNYRLAPDHGEALDLLEISAKEDENSRFYDLFNYRIRHGMGRTIPMKQSIQVSFEEIGIDVQKLMLVDRDRQSNTDERIATLHINLRARPHRDWHITLDIDANAVAQIDVRPAGAAGVSSFRLERRLYEGAEHKTVGEKAMPIWMTFP